VLYVKLSKYYLRDKYYYMSKCNEAEIGYSNKLKEYVAAYNGLDNVDMRALLKDYRNES